MKMPFNTVRSAALAVFAFALVSSVSAQVMLVPRGSAWKYHNLNTDLGTAWRTVGYDDSAWSGPAPGPLGDNVEGGIQQCASVIDIGPAGARYPGVYYRRTFSVTSAASYSQLTLRLNRDDFAVVFLNGTLLYNDGVLNPDSPFVITGGTATAGADEATFFEYTVSSAGLVEGANVLAVFTAQQAAGSSDLQFDLEMVGEADLAPPVIIVTAPPQGSTVLSLTSIEVVFNEAVRGVNTADLLINTIPASSMTSNNPNDYTFFFPQPGTGLVAVAFDPGHAITDASAGANAFAGASWTYTLDTNISTLANVVISEFLADNNNGAKDDDGTRQDWIELYNSGPLSANLQGWFLTDETNNLTKWRLPSVNLAANNWLLIWASNKDRTNPAAPLHTNFKLAKNAGSYLALVDASTNIVSSFSNYVAQLTDVSYGRDQLDPNQFGYLTPPTPGAANARSGPGFLGPPVASVPSGVYTNSSLTLALTNTNGFGTMRYTTDATAPTTNSTIYTVPLALSVNSTIKARIFPPAGTNLLPSDVLIRNFIFLDTTSTNFTSKLPTMIISTEGRGIPANVPPGGSRAKGSVVIIDTQNGRSSIQAQPDVQEVADFEIYGQTSAGFPKLPIRMEIQDGVGNDRDVGILGMPADSDWRLRNPYNDKTEMNDFLGFELWEKMGHYSVRRKFVEVFVDSGGGRVTYPGDYYGIMVLCETIKVNKDRVDIPRLSPYSTNLTATNGGFIFARDKDSGGDLNFTTVGGPGFQGILMKLHEPKPNDLRLPNLQGVTTTFPGPGYTPSGTNQMTYLRNFLGTMERMLYTNDWTTRTGTNHYSYYLDPIAFADQMIHVELTKQIDGYRLSDYFNKGQDGRIGPGPVWDWNLAFGNADYAQGGMTNTWYYEVTGEADHPWARRLITGASSATASTGDPNFVQLISDRWSIFRTNILNGTNLLQRIDEIAILLQESAARDLYSKYRSGLIGTYTWPNPGGTGDGRDVDYVHPTNYFGVIETVAPTNQNGSIVGQMKKWMLGRFLWFDSQFTGVPRFSAPDGMVSNGFPVTITPPVGATLYYRLDGVDPRASGGSIVSGSLSNNGPVIVTVNANVRIVARAQKAGAWKSTFSGPNAVSLYTIVPSLRITEIMYHPGPPPAGSTNAADDFEYIEVKNIGAVPLNVNGYSLSGGVQFTFPNVSLAAGQSAVVVANVAAFQSLYGTNALILGTYTGSLDNAGDHLVLSGSLFESILDFSYADNWYPATDGGGFSLVVVDENAAASAWNFSSNWRPSAILGGSPGVSDPAAIVFQVVVVNEILANADPAAGDAVELRNTSIDPAPIGGWFLTDNFGKPKKFVIPAGTIIPGGGFMVFLETNSFGATNAYTANGTNSFGLGAKGDDIYLFSGDGTNLTGYAHGFDFGASASNSTLGRYVISSGADHFVAQTANTLGGDNAGPLVGPVIVSEIQYHPPDLGINGIGFNDTENEFIELRNLSGTPAPLYDPSYPTNSWHLREAVDYDFPLGVTLPAGGYLFVVGFDPVAYPATLAAFRSNNLVPTNVPVFGPWSGSLNNDSARVELERPDVPDTNGSVPYILVERVGYSDTAPWPAGADGYGLTLQRVVGGSYANDATNWVAAAPTPGGDFVGGGVAPVITSQPANLSNIFGANIVLSASATGTEPLRFQWRFNGFNLPGATNSTLPISNFQSSHIGTYNVFVFNSAGSVIGTNFSISGRLQLLILLQPVDRSSLAGQTNNFQVAAVGTGSIRYQWRKDGVNVTGYVATNATLSVTNSQLINQGAYTCLISDDIDSLLSNPATLTIIARPAYTLHPIAQTVVQGGTVSFSVEASGTAPMSFRWRSNAVTFVPAVPPFTSNTVYFTNGYILTGLSNSILVLTNVGTNYHLAPFSAVITNLAGSASGPRSVVLTVLADTDQDGLPDSWETNRVGFGVNDPADGPRDDDGDSMTNAEEYFAGTDPFNAASYLKVELPSLGPALVRFNAISNRTYTVEYIDGLQSAPWLKLGDVLARTNNRVEVLTDPTATTNRFYRLVIPTRP